MHSQASDKNVAAEEYYQDDHEEDWGGLDAWAADVNELLIQVSHAQKKVRIDAGMHEAQEILQR